MGVLFGKAPKDKTASLLAQQQMLEGEEKTKLENIRMSNIKRKRGGLGGTIMTSGQGLTDEANVNTGYLLG